jgi:hypothetical protein
MRIAFAIILFFLCINVSSGVVMAMDLLPIKQTPYATQYTINSLFNIPSLTILGVSVIGGLFMHNPAITFAGLIVFAISSLLPVGNWILLTLPLMLEQMGVNAAITNGLGLLFSFVWFMFIMDLLSGRLYSE